MNGENGGSASPGEGQEVVRDKDLAVLLIIDKFEQYFAKDWRRPDDVIAATEIYENDEDFIEDAARLGVPEYEAKTCRAMTVPRADGGIAVLAKEKHLGSGSLVHEYIHAFSSKNAFNAWGSIVDDGLAEFFTQRAIEGTGIDRSAVYKKATDIVKSVYGLVGEEPLARALFGGEIDVLNRVVDNELGVGAWALIVSDVANGNYDSAENRLKRHDGP